MKICKYGITLNRLRQEDLDFVLENRKSENTYQLIDSGDEIKH